MSPLPHPSWKLLTSLLMLSLVPVVAGAVRLSGLAELSDGSGVTPENARFVAMPVPVVLHIVCASLYGVRWVVGLAMLLAVVVSIHAVLKRRIARHKAWMVRAYALGQGAGTQVLILLPVTLMAGAPTFFFRDVLMASAWGLNALFAEWIIRRRLTSA